MKNFTIFKEFLLVDISSSGELQVLQGLLFLMIYLGARAGHFLTFTVIVMDTHLHSPVYFFIGNLSFIDFGYISVTVPNSNVNFLKGSKLITCIACAAQTFLFIFFGSTEFFFLVVMSYDRYIAICHPLHYGLTMTPSVCTQAAGVSWASGVVYSAVHTGTLFRLPFTASNVIHQYFCDVPQIIQLSSSNVQFFESVSAVIFYFPILSTSYVHMFFTVLQRHSVEAQNKALSTCSPQVAAFILFVVSGLFAVLGPGSNVSTIQTRLMAMLYAMVPPSQTLPYLA